MAPILREPPVKPNWPPKGYAHKIEVSMADDWWILSARYGRTDAWDIIVYNFNTRDPNEVNWYLHHWVGCTTTTADGKNYEFGTDTGKKLYIYIPPASWTPPTTADDFARERVRQVLHSSAVTGMYISVYPYHMSIAGHDFRKIGYFINTERIDVRHNAAHPQAAEYVSADDKMILSSLTTSAFDRSYIVHEAVHASFDYRRSQGVYTQVVTEECFAYIVQMVYLQGVFGSIMPSWGTFPAKPIWDAAWPIANDIRAGRSIDFLEAQHLKDVLVSTGPYRGTDPNRGTDHNGIN